MDTPTKQRLVGAAVLIALAVIFLPMLVKGPAPDSGVGDVPLEMPDEPGDIETRELPLVTPQAGEGDVLGPAPVEAEGDRLPTVDTASRVDPEAAAEGGMQPATVAGGEYAVHFGAYANRADATTVVGQLRDSQLAGYSEQATLNGRQVWRVRIGPFATRADAEAARLRAAHVRDDVKARVVVLDADGDAAPAAAQPASASQPVASAEPSPPKPEPLPPEPARPEAAAPAPAAQPAASGTGFAVQVGAFGNAAEATRLRDRLRASGFSAFTESVQSDKGRLTRVRVGPVLSRPEAERLRAQVSARAGVSGIVRPHP